MNLPVSPLWASMCIFRYAVRLMDFWQWAQFLLFIYFRVAHRICWCTSCISCHLVKSGLYRCFALHKCQQKNKVKRKNHNEIITHLFYVQRGRPPQEQTKMQNVQKYFFLWVSNTRQLWWEVLKQKCKKMIQTCRPFVIGGLRQIASATSFLQIIW